MRRSFLRRIRSRFMWQVTKFSAVGVSNTLVDAGVFTALVLLFSWTGGGWVVIASAIGFIAGGVNSYLWNSRVTFGTGYQGAELSAVMRFALVVLSGVVLTSAIVAMLLWVQATGPSAIAVAKGAAIVTGAVWNFILQRYWVFAIRPGPQPRSQGVSMRALGAGGSDDGAETDRVAARTR